jgi:Kef-type K+ transport system membrane component KefB
VILLLQVAVILALARVLRWLVVPLGQPAVVGEMAAGLLIGPSCLGWLLPRVEAALFPAASLDSLNALSQLGLVLFMFIVGVRVRAQTPGVKRGVAAVTSVVSITVPFALGVVLALTLRERLAPAGVGDWAFALFVGAAMSITAFPVLARILVDRGLLGTDVGTIAIAFTALWLGAYNFLNSAIWGNSFVAQHRWTIPIGVIALSFLVGLAQKYLHAPNVIHGGFVEAMTHSAHHTIHMQLSVCAEHYFQ